MRVSKNIFSPRISRRWQGVMVGWVAFFLWFGLLHPGSVGAQEEQPVKYALLIGIDKYPGIHQGITPLRWVLNDINELKVALENQGFKVTKLANDDRHLDRLVAEDFLDVPDRGWS
jgi:hypothetical protein